MSVLGAVYPPPLGRVGGLTGRWFSAASPALASLSENVLETQSLGPYPRPTEWFWNMLRPDRPY